MSDADELIDGLDPEAETGAEAAEAEQQKQAEEAKATEQQQKQDKQPEFVPLAKFLETKNANKELQQRIDRLENTIVPALEKMREQQKKQPEPEKPKPPDYMEDPQGYVDHQSKAVAEEVRKLSAKLDQTSQQSEQLQLVHRIQARLASSEEAFVGETGEHYYEALEYARKLRLEDLRDFYPKATQDQLLNLMNQEEFQAGAQMLGNGVNPAEVMYKYALRRGFKPPEDTTEQKKGEEATGGEDEEKKELAEGLGGQTAGNKDIDDLLNAEGDEFDAAMSELFGRKATSTGR